MDGDGDVSRRQLQSGHPHLRKSYKNAQLRCFDGVWMFPLSQAETFGCIPAAAKAQVRVKWKNGVIEGAPLYGLRVRESISKEVL